MVDRKEYKHQWYLDNYERITKKHEQYRENNREQLKENQRRYRKDYPERARGCCKKYYENNSESLKKSVKEYSKTENGKANNQRKSTKRRVREKEIINTLTAKEWIDILSEYNYQCVYCGVKFNKNIKPERDHVIPISKGGNNIKENIVPACRSCNSIKGSNNLTSKFIPCIM